MKINRQELLDILKAVKPGLASKEMIEQSTSFVFEKGRVYTYNDEVAISHPAPKGLTGIVQAKEFYSLLDKLKDEEIEIECTSKELKIQSRRKKAGILLEKEILLPIKEINTPSKWKKLPKLFIDAIDFCVFSASTNMSRPELTCLFISKNIVQSCDGFRMSEYNMGKSKVEKEFLLPATSAILLKDYAPKEYAITKGWGHFKNGQGTIFSCRLGEGNFPDIKRHFEVSGIELEMPKKLLSGLSRADIFANNQSGNNPYNSDTPYVLVNLEKGKMSISSKNSAGWFKEDIRVKYKGTPISFEVNSNFLKKILPILEVTYINKEDKNLPEKTGKLSFKGDNFVHCFTILLEDK